MRKPDFAYAKTKTQISCTVMISASIFASRIVHSLFLYPKFQASSFLLRLYRPVCVGPGRKPQRWFSNDAAHFNIYVNGSSFLLNHALFTPHYIHHMFHLFVRDPFYGNF